MYQLIWTTKKEGSFSLCSRENRKKQTEHSTTQGNNRLNLLLFYIEKHLYEQNTAH